MVRAGGEAGGRRGASHNFFYSTFKLYYSKEVIQNHPEYVFILRR